MDENSKLAEKLATAWRFFYDKGYIEGFGHISARTADAKRMLISRHSLGRLGGDDDFVVVDMDGHQDGPAARLPGEFFIHSEIYKRRPDVGSIAHFHCLYPTSFGMSEQQLRPTYFLASIFRSGIPIHPDPRLVNNRERGAALAETLGIHRAAIMKAHGIVVVGRDVEEMFAGTYILDDNAHRTWISASMGEVEFLTDEVMAEVEAEMLATRGPFGRIWSMCECHVRDLDFSCR